MHESNRTRPWHRNLQWLAAAWLALQISAVSAASVNAWVVDQEGEPVDDAVLYLHLLDGQAPPVAPATAEVDQVDKTFIPHVQVVTPGSAVSFPNSDDIRHHVYSFSEAKSFELPLYIGTPASPVIFDQVGVVDLGCNIHDFMRAYILVLASPYYARSSAGQVRLDDLPTGTHQLRIWHPRLVDEQEFMQTVVLTGQDAVNLDVTLELRGELTTRRAPKRRARRY